MGPRNPAQRRYVLRVAIATAAYLITLAAAVRLVGRGEVTGPLAWLLALLPGLSVAGFFWAIGRLLIEEKDEYLRMLLVRQVLVATAFALSITSVWGFLENFRLVDHVDAYWVAILWFFGLGVGAFVNRLTLGTAGGGCA
ncbi:MAG: hypothetical protein JWO81_2775 [Alphaproteobacteria bacterium]|nr:hypothetical protein [Alphaproteobacteria bacterium]